MLFVHLLLSPLIFSPLTVEGFEFVKVALLLLAGIVVTGLGLCALAEHLGGGMREAGSMLRTQLNCLRRQPIAVGVLLFLASAVVSTAASLSPRTSWNGAADSYAGLQTVLGYTALFFATRTLCRTPEQARRLLTAPAAAALIVAAYAAIQVAGADPITWDRLSISPFGQYIRPFASLGHPNALAAYLVMALPLSLFFARQAQPQRHWLLLSLHLLSVTLSALVIVAALSRGAWAALAAVGIVLFMDWRRTSKRRWGRAVMVSVGVAALFLAVAAVLIASGQPLWSTLGERVRHAADLGGRGHLWPAGWRIFLDHPLVGCGLDTFGLAFQPHRSLAYWRIEWNMMPTRAHNELLQVLATQGLLGATAVLLVTFGLVRAGIRRWRRGTATDPILRTALLAGVVGFYVQDLFSFTVAACGALFVTFAALLSGLEELDAEPKVPRPVAGPASLGRLAGVRLLQAGIVAAAVGGIVGWVLRPLEASCACQAADQVLRVNPQLAIHSLERAVSLEPGQELYWTRLGQAAETGAKGPLAPGERRRLLLKACGAFERAVELLPVSSVTHANLGRLLAELALEARAEPAPALAEFDTALSIDPNSVLIHAEAGNAALMLGELRRAQDYCDRGLALNPDFGPLRALPGAIALRQGRWDEAARLFQAARGRIWYYDEATYCKTLSMVALANLNLKRYDAARADAQEVLAGFPDAAATRFLLGRALEGLGRRAEAVREYRRIPDYEPAQAALQRLGF